MADVDFGGSTGYGREYRYALEHQWGVVDVEDAASAAAFLAEQGLADPKKLAIDGGSAGGFTTLAALTFTDTFTAGCCCYGISDLEILAADTHKFESRYLDFCIGPYPEERDRYKARSPLNHLDKVSTCGRTGRGRGLTEMNRSRRPSCCCTEQRTRCARPGGPWRCTTRR